MHRSSQKKAQKPSAAQQKHQKLTKRKIATKAKKLVKKPSQTKLTTTTTFSRFFSAEAANAAEPEVEQYGVFEEEKVIYSQRDLGLAAHQGDVLKLKECLAQSFPKLDINALDSYGQTPLIHAIKQRHVKSMQILISGGADINKVDSQKRWSPFFYAIRRNSVSLFKAFMAHNPEVNITAPKNTTAMTVAGQAGAQIFILNELLNLGLNIHHRDDHGKTPLMYAASTSHTKDLEWWLNEGADPRACDKFGKSAMTYSLKGRPDHQNYNLLKSRTLELRKLHKMELAETDEDSAVKAALQQIKTNINEKNKIIVGERVKSAAVATPTVA